MVVLGDSLFCILAEVLFILLTIRFDNFEKVFSSIWSVQAKAHVLFFVDEGFDLVNSVRESLLIDIHNRHDLFIVSHTKINR